MTALSKTALKALWKAYFQPTSADFSNLIDSWTDYKVGLETLGQAVSAGSVGVPRYISTTTVEFLSVGATGQDLLGAGTAASARSVIGLSGLTLPVSVANGGTGVASLSANHVLLGNGTSAVQLVAPGTSGNVLTSNGTTWQSAAPAAVPTGSVTDYVGSTAPTGWVLLDGRTIGSSSSGATNRANSDTQTLFELLWNSMANAEAPVSSGRGASAAADFAANKTITLPDARGRVIAGKDDMGGTTASRLTSGGSGITGTTLGVSGGTQTHTLTTAQLASHSHSGGIAAIATGVGAGSCAYGVASTGSEGSGQAHQNTQPTLVLNKIIKL